MFQDRVLMWDADSIDRTSQKFMLVLNFIGNHPSSRFELRLDFSRFVISTTRINMIFLLPYQFNFLLPKIRGIWRDISGFMKVSDNSSWDLGHFLQVIARHCCDRNRKNVYVFSRPWNPKSCAGRLKNNAGISRFMTIGPFVYFS